MAGAIPTGPINHITFTVADPERARTFYQIVLGFRDVGQLPAGFLMTNGTILLGLRRPADPSHLTPSGRFDESIIGLDHVSFGFSNRAELERAVEMLDEHGIDHGEVEDHADAGITNVFFRDPDNIQLEFTCPYAG
jgi:catechol 2,3-dioxygenase-like lactoylglutathione lyase family enzyme